MNVTLTINGEPRAIDVEPWETVLTVVRDRLGLTGAKRGCNQGVCGACTVLLDGRTVRGCLSLAVNCTEAEITTVEGLSKDGELVPVQRAFAELGAVQCGFCTSGMVLAAHALLAKTPQPATEDIRLAISGNLCRCSGYVKVIDAVHRAAEGSN